jgi:hypothetical protein
MTMSGPSRHFVHLLLLCTFAALPGCASLPSEIPMTTLDVIASREVSFGVRTQAADGQFEVLPSSLIARRLQAQLGDRPLSILALSAGGAGGAFGAGAVVGLTQGGTRSAFSVVTGVSAGALVAPYAFLGPAWDQEVTAIYTQESSQGLLQRRILGAVFGSSMYSGTPLRQLIERHAGDAMIQAVAAEAAKGRLLLVATTDLATGEPVIWDLGSVAMHGGRDAKKLFRTILLASASVPGMFPPVTVKFRAGGHMHEETHVDGAVTMPFFIAPAPDDLPQSAQGMPPTMVRIVIDSRLRDLPRATRATAVAIFSRGIAAGLTGMMRTTLEWNVAAVRQRGISVDYAAIPVSYPLRSAFDFGRDAQRSLFQYASTCAEAGRLWKRVQQSGDERAAERRAVPEGTKCPADDLFIGRFAALEN